MEAVLLHNSDHIASVRGLVGMVLVVGHVLLDKLLVHGDFESRNNPLEILKGDGGDLDLGAHRSHLALGQTNFSCLKLAARSEDRLGGLGSEEALCEVHGLAFI